jgi:hypothetical protein
MRLHLAARDHVVMDWAPALYVIRVNGHLGGMTLSAFPGMTPQQKDMHTVLTGWLDRSARYGVLAEMEALGLVLLEVRRMEPHGKSLESGDTPGRLRWTVRALGGRWCRAVQDISPGPRGTSGMITRAVRTHAGTWG